MKKTKFVSFKISILLILLPFLVLYSSSCNNSSSAESSRDVTISVVPHNSVLACSNTATQEPIKQVQVSVTVWEYDSNTNQPVNPVTQTIFSNTSLWETNANRFTFKLGYKPYKVMIQCWQGCSWCCNIGSNLCTGAPSFLKNASLYFYGEQLIPNDGTSFNQLIVLQQCDCRGC